MTAILAFFTASALGRLLAKIGAAVLLILTFGAYQRRAGAKAAKARQADADAKAFKKTIKEVADEKADSGPVDVVRGRMRERGKRRA